ncbi:MAG: hypothetical protein ABI882_02435 [Acidobacteriota bacterium]
MFDQRHPTVIVVAGTSSDIGKTSLACELLASLQGWEAIKLTRGHYRSCGKNAEACCVSHLLGSEPKVYSEPEATRVSGKDTDRFWAAGASAVHWVVAKSDQVEKGMCEALSRVRAVGVVIEGTSVLKFIKPAFSILVASASRSDVKPSARQALESGRVDAIYFTDGNDLGEAPILRLVPHVRPPLFTQSNRDDLLATAIASVGAVPMLRQK